MKHLGKDSANVILHRLKVIATHKRTIFFAAAFVWIAALLNFLAVALDNALYFQGVPFNGSFQLLDPLIRIGQGEAIGRDFNFFHGPGMPYLHYIFFWVFGSDLFASELAKWIVSPLVFLASTYLFLYFAFMRNHFNAFVGTSIVLMVALAFYNSYVYPGNAMLGVRSFAVMLPALIIMHSDKLRWPVTERFLPSQIFLSDILVGAGIAICFMFGSEYGLGSLGAYVLTLLIMRGRSFLGKMAGLGVTLVALTIVALFILVVLTKGHPLEPLIYALKDVPADQFWYFGTPPNKFFHSFSDAIRVLKEDGLIRIPYILFLAALFIVYLFKKKFGHTNYYYSFIFLLFAGFLSQVSMLGYYHSAQTFQLARGATLILVVAGTMLLAKPFSLEFKVKGSGKNTYVRRLTSSTISNTGAACTVLASIILGTFYVYSIKNTQDVRATAIHLKQKVQGDKTQVLSPFWEETMSGIMPIVQKDNAYDVADYKEPGYEKGVNQSTSTVVLRTNRAAIKPGSVVYFVGAGRQTVQSLELKNDVTLLKFKNGTSLSPDSDGAPHKVVVGKDFVDSPSTLWSTYTALVDYEKGVNNPSSAKADYIIHALGQDKREQYIKDFHEQKPDYVLTINKNISMFEEWLQNENWEFYDLVIANYHVAKETSGYILWEKNDTSWVGKAPTTEWQDLKIAGTNIIIPGFENSGERKVGLVKIEYDLSHKKPYDKVTRWFLKPFGDAWFTELPASVAPYKSEITFPFVYLPTPNGPPPEGNNFIEIHSYSVLPVKSDLIVKRAQIAWLEVDQETQRVLSNDLSYQQFQHR